MAHHTNDAGETFVDTDFVNDAQRVHGVELRHIGFGEFVFNTPKGEAEVDRMRGEDFPGQKGRSHKLYDDRHGSGAAEWLVTEVEKHNLSQRVAGLRSAVIRLAHVRGDLRPHLLPLLKGAGTTLPSFQCEEGHPHRAAAVWPGRNRSEMKVFRILAVDGPASTALIVIDARLDGVSEPQVLESLKQLESDGHIESRVTGGKSVWVLTSRPVRSAKTALTEPDARVWYVGGGSWACNVNGEDLRGLRAAFPKSTRRVSRNPNAADSYSIYTTERGSNLIKAWLQEHGRTVGGSPQWDLAPGEMPSW